MDSVSLNCSNVAGCRNAVGIMMTINQSIIMNLNYEYNDVTFMIILLFLKEVRYQ
jgi:hypothetical protein